MAITNVILFLLNALLCFVSATAIHSLISRLRASNGALRYSWLALGAMVTGAGLWVCQFIGRLATGGLPAGELPAAGVFAGIAATITMVWCYSVTAKTFCGAGLMKMKWYLLNLTDALLLKHQLKTAFGR